MSINLTSSERSDEVEESLGGLDKRRVQAVIDATIEDPKRRSEREDCYKVGALHINGEAARYWPHGCHMPECVTCESADMGRHKRRIFRRIVSMGWPRSVAFWEISPPHGTTEGGMLRIWQRKVRPMMELQTGAKLHWVVIHRRGSTKGDEHLHMHGLSILEDPGFQPKEWIRRVGLSAGCIFRWGFSDRKRWGTMHKGRLQHRIAYMSRSPTVDVHKWLRNGVTLEYEMLGIQRYDNRRRWFGPWVMETGRLALYDDPAAEEPSEYDIYIHEMPRGVWRTWKGDVPALLRVIRTYMNQNGLYQGKFINWKDLCWWWVNVHGSFGVDDPPWTRSQTLEQAIT